MSSLRKIDPFATDFETDLLAGSAFHAQPCSEPSSFAAPGERMPFEFFNPAFCVAALFLAALLVPFLGRKNDRFPATLWALVPAAIFIYFLSGAGPIWQGTTWRSSFTWAPELGMDWDIWVSPVGLLLALLVSGIGTLIVIYAAAYLKGSDRLGRFLCYLFLFAGAMLGIAVTENALALFVFWELTSIASYLLIGHYHEKLESRKSALDALLVTAGGGVALLAGFLLLGEITGSYRIGVWVEAADAIRAHPLYTGAFLCVLLGAITKSAQFPFHFWLPGAMAAPAPVSAYLHSATMVKVGIFLLAILHPALGGTDLWHYTLLALGAITMVWGALVAMVQSDLKRLLAFSTVSALGTLTMLLGMEHTLSVKVAMLFFIVHALYKGALFMVAGALEKGTGTREISQLRGLMRSFPVLGIAAVVAAFSMSGLPPFIGFIAKELLYEVKLETPVIGISLLICGIVANAANIVVALKVGVLPFLGEAPSAEPKSMKPTKIGYWIGPVLLGFGSIAFGVFPDATLGRPLEAMVAQIAAEEVTIKLKLWHGFNLVLLLSLVTVLSGVGLFLIRKRLTRYSAALREGVGWNGTTIFRSGITGFLHLSGFVTRTIQSGRLHSYLAVIFSVAVVGLVAAWWKSGYTLTLPARGEIRPDVAILTIVLALAAVALVRCRRRMASVLILGCIGFGIAGFFALHGAPDLAITQILVETLTLLLFALALYGLPAMREERRAGIPRVPAVVISVAVGLAFTLLTLKAFDVQVAEPVSLELAAKSLPEAFGKNVVNVILVDFRALDTLGEITVLLIAALGVSAMLGTGRSRYSRERLEASPVLAASARYTAPAMLIFSLYLLLRGHNEPGGGFIGGLVAAMSAVLVHLAHPAYRLRIFRLGAGSLLVVGLAAAMISGMPGLFSGTGFLTAQWGPEFSLPAVGKVKMGTPLVFDIGVYLVVAGVVLTLYEAMERSRLREKVEPEPAPTP